MALKDTNIAEEYPYAFMVSQSIYQSIPAFADSQAEYSLSMVFRFYKIESNAHIFDNDSQLTIDIDNFTIDAIYDASNGNMTHVNTLEAQQLSVKKLLEDHSLRTFEVVV